jgi:hypothetical protein
MMALPVWLSMGVRMVVRGFGVPGNQAADATRGLAPGDAAERQGRWAHMATTR